MTLGKEKSKTNERGSLLPVIRAMGSNQKNEGFFEWIGEGTISCGITESNMETFDLHFVFSWDRNGMAF